MDLPVDGWAPDIAGQNKASPLGAIGKVTADLRPSGAPATTGQVGESVCAAIG
jgi:3-isopropylmalate dehydrogenase